MTWDQLMRRLRQSALCCLAAIVAIQVSAVEESIALVERGFKQEDPSVTQQEIKRGLNTLQEMAKEKGKYDRYARSLGFASVEEALKATPGKQLQIYRVNLDKLKTFQDSTNPELLLEEKPRTFLVPILIEDKVRSSFMIAEFDGGKKWRIIGQGSSNILKGQTQQSLVKLDAVVLINDLRVRFLARMANGQVLLTPISDYPLFKLKADKEYSLKKIFTTLQPLADRVAQASADSPEAVDPSLFRGSSSQPPQ